jgi:hypothetical protein
MRVSAFVGVVSAAAMAMFMTAAPSRAAVLTIDLDNYASAVDTTPGVLQATMKVTDVAGGVDVKVTLDAATLFAKSGGAHITIAWNLDKAEGAVTGYDTTLFTLSPGTNSPPGCVVSCGSFAFTGLQGTWTGTSPPAPSGPITFMIAGITTADFLNNSAGFMAAVDVLGPKGTGEVAGTGTLSAVPEPSTWAMMLIGFAGLGFAGYRQRRKLAVAASV